MQKNQKFRTRFSTRMAPIAGSLIASGEVMPFEDFITNVFRSNFILPDQHLNN